MTSEDRLTVKLLGGGPWGFRLTGGAGTGQPLVVSKIRRKSKAQHQLKEGDLILAVNGVKCQTLTYDEAMNVVDEATDALVIDILRSKPGKENVAPPRQPSKQETNTVEKITRVEATPLGQQENSRKVESATKAFAEDLRLQQTTSIQQQSSRVVRETETKSIHHEQTQQSVISPPSPSKPFFPVQTNFPSQSPPPPQPLQPQQPPPPQQLQHIQQEIRQTQFFQEQFQHPQFQQQQKEHPPQQPIAPPQLQHPQFQPAPPLQSPVQAPTPFQPSQPQPPQSVFQPVQPPPSHPDTTVMPQLPFIGPTFNAKAAQLSSKLFPLPKPFSAPESDLPPTGQERVVSFEQTSDDKHFHQLKTEQTREKTDHSQSSTFLREEQSITRDGTDLSQPQIDQQPSKPVSSIIQDLEEATRDFNRVAEAMSATSLSNVNKSIESNSQSLFQVSKFESKETSSSESRSMWSSTGGQTQIQPPLPCLFDNAASQGGPQPVAGLTSEFATTSSSSEFYSHSSTAGNSAYQPSPEADEMGSTSLLTRRRKMYTSSSFYEEPQAIYPTVEEQVELCRKIADSLSDDTNKKSRGANMFYKRVKRAHKWVHESGLDAYSSDGCATDSELDPQTPDLTSAPYIKVSKGPPKLKLIMAPREIVDMQKLRSIGQAINEHNVVSPDICLDLVRDLNSPCGRGAALFAKRKQKAVDWVVDEERVKAKTEARKASMAGEPLPDIFPLPLVPNPRVKLVKSPWEAAMESPIGCCDAAFMELPPVVGGFMAQSIIQAAEHKLANSPEVYDPSSDYLPQGQSRAPGPIYKPVAPISVDIYRPKAPKGWKGTTHESVPRNRVEPELAPFAPQSEQPPFDPQHLTQVPTTTPRPLSFHDFNTIPRTWSNAKSNPLPRTASFRPVKPPGTSF